MEIGDRVKLMSDGPVMTVIDATGPNLNCVWFAEDNELKQAFLPAAAVRLATAHEKGIDVRKAGD